MRNILTTTALASALVLGTFAIPVASAQDAQPSTQECTGDNCPGAGGTMKGSGDQGQGVTKERSRRQKTDQGGDQDSRKMRDSSAQGESTDQDQPRRKRADNKKRGTDVDVDVNVDARARVGDGKWRFDPDRHQRRRSKNTTFRFYYGGYWYPQPYWEVYTVRSGRLSCGEGRRIVSERYNRVRVVECNGRVYTYLGRRQGDTYRIMLNARSGRIIDRNLI